MSNVASFAAHHHAKHGPTTMRAALAEHHNAERARIAAGDNAAFELAVTRLESSSGLGRVLDPDMRELLAARLGRR